MAYATRIEIRAEGYGPGEPGGIAAFFAEAVKALEAHLGRSVSVGAEVIERNYTMGDDAWKGRTTLHPNIGEDAVRATVQTVNDMQHYAAP